MNPTASPTVTRTRRAILDAATTVLARDPGASLGAIAEAAGVGRTTLHRHYADRASLIEALAVDASEATRAAFVAARIEEGDPVAALGRVVHELVALGDRFAFLLREPQLAGNPVVEAAEAEDLVPIVALVARGQASGVIRADLPSRWIAEVIGIFVYGAWAAVGSGVVARADAPALALTTLLDGLRPRT